MASSETTQSQEPEPEGASAGRGNSGASFEELKPLVSSLAFGGVSGKVRQGAEDSSDVRCHLWGEAGVKVLVRNPSLRFQFGADGH